MPLTYPHSVITTKCKKKYYNKWDIMECVINSIQLYYKKINKDDVEKYVIIPELNII